VVNGVLNIDKPAGMTSHDVVARVRRIAHQKRVGHAGTLDPDATGVLLVCLGHATRIADLLAEQGKRYRATLMLGTTTTSEDATGEILERRDAYVITHERLQELLPQFIGEIEQIPPMVSAVHHDGKRLYELARKGIVVERTARTIRVDSIDLLSFEPGPNATATLDVVCGKGAYIRTLCADIGGALDVGGHMATLRRTRIGRFEAGDATSVTLEELEKDGVQDHLISASEAISFLALLRVQENQMADLKNGKDLCNILGLPSGELVRLVSEAGGLVGLGRIVDDHVHPEKVFKDE